MFNKAPLYLIIYIYLNIKINYPSQKLEFKKDEEPTIWKIQEKNLNNFITITFLLKINSSINYNHSFFSFGYYNLFFEKINIFKKNDSNKNFLRFNNEEILNSNILNNTYYYFFFEIEKITIYRFLFHLNYELNFGTDYNIENTIKIKSLNYTKYLDLKDFYINLGSGMPQEKIKFDFKIENLTLYHKKWSILEKRNIINGDSNTWLFLDFSNSLSYSQYFHNKIDNNFTGGINGNSINNDEFDLFHEYLRISDTTIKKKLYLFNLKQYIKLPQEIIKYLHEFDINNFIIYLKISIHLNNSSRYMDLDIDYKLYNRENKNGININLINLNENSTNKFEFKINFIESSSNFQKFIIEEEKLNIDYLIIRYEKLYFLNKYNIIMDFKLNNNKYDLELIENTNNFSSTDNHYIGDYDSSKLLVNYILIEIEEFMLGKGTFIKNLYSETENIIYENIKLYCNELVDNKINRENLENCEQRNEIININENCEYFNETNCIFKLPDYNESNLNSEINEKLFNLLSTKNMNPTNIIIDLISYINTIYTTTPLHYSFTSVSPDGTASSSPNISSFNFSNLSKIIKPYKQLFNNSSNININLDLNNNTDENFINYSYSSNFDLNNNNLIIEIIFVNQNIWNNIFEIEFNNKKYSNFVINNNLDYSIISVEIYNNTMLNNPNLKIINLSGNHSFTIISIKLLEIKNIINNSNKFIGEKIDHNHILIKNKWYTEDNSVIAKYRNVENLYIKCDSSCNECKGPNNNNCVNCDDDFLNYNNRGCIKKNASNCLNFGVNPSFCSDCISNSEKIIIDNNRVKCFICHSDCRVCNDRCKMCSRECLNCNILEEKNENLNCLNCSKFCFFCNKNCNSCFGDWSTDCYQCDDYNQKINYRYPTSCRTCVKYGIFSNDRKEICNDCHSSCWRCFDTNKYSCLSCRNGNILYYNNVCKPIYPVNKCEPNHVFRPSGSYFYEIFNKCLKCGEGCFTCNLSNLEECVSCLYGYHLLNKRCVRCNKEGEIINYKIKDLNDQQICSLCHSSCKNCKGESQNDCTNCYENYYLQKEKINFNKCTLCNEIGYYIKNEKCLKCDTNCLNCVGGSKNCTSCKNDYVLNDNICSLECKKGTYLEKRKCKICYKNCWSCYNSDKFSCIECKNNYYLINITNECVKCNKINNFIINKNCFICHNNCRSCYGINENNCLSCNNSLILYEQLNECVKYCPEKNYKVKINNLYYCKNCFKGCLTCLDFKENTCLSCEDNWLYNKYTKRCLKKCENGYFKVNKTCEKCDIRCSICLSYDFCLKCNKKFYLLKNNSCSTCNEEGHYIKEDKCLNCNSNCLNCIDYDNCLSCEETKNKILDKNNNKYYCEENCENDKFFNKKLNKCIYCNECDICQIKNDYFCKNCKKCNNNCILNTKFNETGLYFFNHNNSFSLNYTLIKVKNNDIIEDFKENNNTNYFKILNNNYKLKEINLKLNNLSILESKNCIYKNEYLKIKKEYNNICKIKNVYYNEKNIWFFEFNFKYDKYKIKNNFGYRISNTNENLINYIIHKNNITLISDNKFKFKFIPNYFKKKFNLTFYFDNKIIQDNYCKKLKYLKIDYLINLKEIFYESDIKGNLNELKKSLNEDNKITKNLELVKPYVNRAKNGILTSIIFTSFLTEFWSILIRFFQVIYILDYISLLNINLGIYTNTFLKYLSFNLDLYISINDKLKIPDYINEEKIIEILKKNPKLKDFDFIYLTNISLEFIISFVLLIFEILIKLVSFVIDKKKQINDHNYSEIKINKKKEFSKIKYLKIKIRSLKLTYIGIIFPNLLSTILIYFQIFYKFNFNLFDIKLIILFVIYYIFVITYIYEIIITILYRKFYKKQKKNYEYRNKFFLFDCKKDGIHNYIILFTLIRDIILIFFGLLINIPTIFQILIFLIIQILYLILIYFIKSKHDYQKIQLFKLQECVNLILFLNIFILYFSKFELFQFSFVIFYLFLLFVSILNLFSRIFYFSYWKISLIMMLFRNKGNKI